MVQTNEASLVENATKKAYKTVSKSLKNAIKELCVLKAVGPATASGKVYEG